MGHMPVARNSNPDGCYSYGNPHSRFVYIYYLMGKRVDPPSFIPMGLVIIFASMVLAVFAAVLQRLLQEAINIKSENDLTV